jgi:hypothetical protein
MTQVEIQLNENLWIKFIFNNIYDGLLEDINKIITIIKNNKNDNYENYNELYFGLNDMNILESYNYLIEDYTHKFIKVDKLTYLLEDIK